MPKYHHARSQNEVIWCQMALVSGPAAPPSPRSPRLTLGAFGGPPWARLQMLHLACLNGSPGRLGRAGPGLGRGVPRGGGWPYCVCTTSILFVHPAKVAQSWRQRVLGYMRGALLQLTVFEAGYKAYTMNNFALGEMGFAQCTDSALYDRSLVSGSI